MHDDNCKNENCRNLIASLSNAEKVINIQHEFTQKFYKLFVFVVIVMLVLVLARDYIQYNASYKVPKEMNQTSQTTNINKDKGE